MPTSTNRFRHALPIALCIALCFAALSCPLSSTARGQEGADEEGFVPLFNGKDLTGWVKEGDAGFVVRDGMLVCNGSGNWPTWLRTAEEYENFILRLEFKGFYGAESGVFFHAPRHGLISRTGFEVQLGDNTGRPRRHSPGAIFGAVAPLREAALSYRDEAFNQLEIEVNYPRLRVRLNGQLVQDLDMAEHPQLRLRPRLGHIGLQDRGKPVHFRNLRIKPLPDQVRGQWRPLLNGRDLTGWTISEKCSAQWRIEPDGVLLGEQGHGYLISDETFENCELSCYIRSSPLANGGIFFRWRDERNRGFEIQIEDIPDSNDPTGSIYGRVRAEQLPFTPGEWVLMQVTLNGQHCAVRVNGVIVAESDEMPKARSGNLSLQMHTGKGWVRWQDLRVRPLPPSEQ
ncbi:MAG: DUF1080 domain-containing protein [Planctomycetales bacterium]|nr:DUF1080 domain-containing protein [Planctomycetales bacterium]